MSTIDFFARNLEAYLADLERMVRMETPSGHVGHLEAAADFLVERLAGSAEIDRSDLKGLGPLLRVRRTGTPTRVLLLAHYDTVWPVSSWASPWAATDGRISGPGVYDMKAGLMFIVWMFRHLAATGRPHPTLDALLTPDEEVGSLGSKSHIEAAAQRADFALVLEPATPMGELKLARPGAGEYVVQIRGRAAHQGVNPEHGVNAVVEAAHQILRLVDLKDPAHGTTIGANVVNGGTVSNTVADAAEIRIDVRTWALHEMRRVEHAIHNLRAVLPGARISVGGGWNRPPMEPTPASTDLFRRAEGVGRSIGLDLHWARWGGASDGNIAAQHGVPTLDGLGPAGDGAHEPTEHIVTADLTQRLALLSDLVVSLAPPPESWLSEEALASRRGNRRGATD